MAGMSKTRRRSRKPKGITPADLTARLPETLRNPNTNKGIAELRAEIGAVLSINGELLTEVINLTGHGFIAALRQRLGWKPAKAACPETLILKIAAERPLLGHHDHRQTNRTEQI